jgi:hypothetical protein
MTELVEGVAAMADKELRDLIMNGVMSVGAGLGTSLIALVAQPHLVVVLSAGVLVCAGVIAVRQIFRARKRRPPLIVRVKDTPRWQGLNDKIRVIAAEVEFTNRTRDAIRIEECEFSYEGSDGILERVQLSGNETLAFDDIAHHYYPQLKGFAEVPPHKSISGWYVAPVRRNPVGGTPKCVVTVKDIIGNLYYVTIPAQRPQVYSA